MTDIDNNPPIFRSGPDERAYLLRRAGEHRRSAENTNDMGARSIHSRLEQFYREQARLLEIVLPN